ncbi:MAG TPA: GntR family transcriptional regulator [Solirubrobacteraceae bacterium]|nr:GntR family transcriptional regulator [Solirubrobacteraceae bacterium]
MVDKIVNNLPRWPSAPDPHPENAIRERIINGSFQPNEHLVEADLARVLGVGRSAIRTALARLEQEGLVHHERHRGSRVRLIEKREAVEILEARAALEAMAARHAAARADEHDIGVLREILDVMRRELDRGDLIGASDENAQLHRRILLISQHDTARRLIQTLKSQLVRFQYRTILIPGRAEESFAEHTAIVDAIAARDADRAEQAMRTHLTHVADALRNDASG